MHVIAIAARKGGVGKTTLAMHLSVLASAPGRPALLLDTDPQHSLAWWHRLRKDDEPNLIKADARELPDIIEAARRESFSRVIIDTPPHAEASILSAMRVADLIVVPTRPGPLDLAAVATTLDLAHRLGKAPLAVLNHCPPRTGAAEPAIVTEAGQPWRIWRPRSRPRRVANRVSRSHAILTGSTVNEHDTDRTGDGWTSEDIKIIRAEKVLFRCHAFEGACADLDIEHRLTKPHHPWTTGPVERMNRTIKEATVKRFHYDSHDQLRQHLADFVAAYNFARRLKTLRGLTP